MSADAPEPGSQGELILYKTKDGRTRIDVRLDGDTVWLTQAQMAELFQTSPQNITMHIQGVYAEGELAEAATCKEYLQVRKEGVREVQRLLRHYALDVVIAVGYRVRSTRGTQFRQWATATLREYLVKGFALDDQRLKDGKNFGADYFDELLERIRDIRASERRFYQKITDIYATSIDYAADSPVTQEFYATVQNKLHWAIHGHTAAEIIKERADAAKPNMGLTTWKNTPRGPIRKADVAVAKNYLSKDELDALNRIVTMYLDYAEDQARQKRPMHMADWIKKLDAFLQFTERNILTHAGSISAEIARDHAEREFAKLEAGARLSGATEPSSDFDVAVERLKQLKHQSPPPPTTSASQPRKRKDPGE